MADTSSTEIGIGAEIEPSIHTSNTSESGYDGAIDDGVVTSSASASGGQNGTTSNTTRIGRQVLHTTPSSSALHRASLGSETEGLVLFDLTTKRGAKVAFSPHCMKTILDLKLLSIGYDRQRLTFCEIRSNLASRVAPNVTVPTLELKDGSHLTDSWKISQFLFQNHPKGSLLFPTTSSRSFARMVEGLGKFALAPNLGPLTRVNIAQHLDEESKIYFENEKIGKAKMEKFRSMSNLDKQKHIDACASALEPIEAALIVAKEKSPSRQVWLEAGSLPTHADFTLYGWTIYSRVAGPAIFREIWQTHPAVSKWVQDMNDWSGSDITADFF